VYLIIELYGIFFFSFHTGWFKLLKHFLVPDLFSHIGLFIYYADASWACHYPKIWSVWSAPDKSFCSFSHRFGSCAVSSPRFFRASQMSPFLCIVYNYIYWLILLRLYNSKYASRSSIRLCKLIFGCCCWYFDNELLCYPRHIKLVVFCTGT